MNNLKQLTGFALILLIMPIFYSCEDDCETTYTYTIYEPEYITVEEMRNSVGMREPDAINIPGKIYILGDYLFINEAGKGIHIFDNSDKKSPINMAFLNIPGNYDMAAKGHVLYADNYVDLLVFDISNVNDITLAKRLEGVFQDLYPVYEIAANGSPSIITSYIEKEVQEVYDECEGLMPAFLKGGGFNGGIFIGAAEYDARPMDAQTLNSISPGGLNIGIGGSMARFTIVNDFLYTVGWYNMNVFDIYELENPDFEGVTSIGWDIETIFPYENNLFIGSRSGMYIYNISQPDRPEYVSQFAHVNSCDPVIVSGDIAYVTLRSGNECNGFTNQLDIIDIKNLYNPEWIKTYPMKNPHGLGISDSTLFICEGEYGLKVFDASDIYNIDDHLLYHFTDLHAFDVIPFNEILMLIGEDGFYQYDFSDLENMELLSHIPIESIEN